MKKILVYLCLCFMTSVVLAERIVLDNKTNYPEKDSPGTIAIQWVNAVSATQEANKSIINESKLDLNSLIPLSQKGTNPAYST